MNARLAAVLSVLALGGAGCGAAEPPSARANVPGAPYAGGHSLAKETSAKPPSEGTGSADKWHVRVDPSGDAILRAWGEAGVFEYASGDELVVTDQRPAETGLNQFPRQARSAAHTANAVVTKAVGRVGEGEVTLTAAVLADPPQRLVGTVARFGEPEVTFGLTFRGEASHARALAETMLARAQLIPPTLVQGAPPNAPLASNAAQAERLRTPIDLALTFDDLPFNGPEAAGTSRAAAVDLILATLAKHGLAHVWGFVNGVKVAEQPKYRAILEAWVRAGHPLGNHTYTHASEFKLPLADYLAGIDRNEPLLHSLLPAGATDQSYKYFRYPFLQEGKSLADRHAIRAHLAERGYTVAQVTIDFADWAYAEPYARCQVKQDHAALAALEKSYLQDTLTFTRWSDRAAREVMGRPTKHVMLLHANAATAHFLDGLITRLAQSGVRFVTLEDAQSDPALSVETDFVSEWGSSLYEQIAETRNVPFPPFPLMPLALLEGICL